VAGTDGTRLCALAEIGDPGAKGFVLSHGMRIFVVRRGTDLFGYANSCPHQGTTLDWNPDVFLTVDKTHIQCATHAAWFRIEDGFCVAGPCLGQKLYPVAVRLAGSDVILAD
jgi:nitrite reductase/ring-hydroxylating ferredoxin subunit